MTTVLLAFVALYLVFCVGVVIVDYIRWGRHKGCGPTAILQLQTKKNRTWQVIYRIRSRYSLFSRFGGGWNWKVGAELGGNALCIFLVIAELYIVWGVKPRTWADKQDDNS